MWNDDKLIIPILQMRLLKYTGAKWIGKFSCQLSFLVYLQFLTECVGAPLLRPTFSQHQHHSSIRSRERGAKSESFLGKIKPKTLRWKWLLVLAISTQRLKTYIKSFWEKGSTSLMFQRQTCVHKAMQSTQRHGVKTTAQLLQILLRHTGRKMNFHRKTHEDLS